METCTQGQVSSPVPGQLATASIHPPALPHVESLPGHQRKRSYSVFIEPPSQPSYHAFTAPHRPPPSHEYSQHNHYAPADSFAYITTATSYPTEAQLSAPLALPSSGSLSDFSFQSVTYSSPHGPSTPISQVAFHLPHTPIPTCQPNALSPVISPLIASSSSGYIFQGPPGSFSAHVPNPQQSPEMTRHHYPPPQPQPPHPRGPQQPGGLSQVDPGSSSSLAFGEPYTCHDDVLPPHYWTQPQPMQTYAVPAGPVPPPIDASPAPGMESAQNWDSTHSPPPDSAEDDIAICDANESLEPKKKTRGKFTAEQRQKTAGTRKLKACIRCRMQRVRCIFDPNEPEGVCVTCKNVSKDSKKVIHRVPCLRYKLTETRMFRQGGLKLTRRWDAPQMRDVTDWDGNDIRTIHFTLGICDEPLILNVRKFSPRDGDVLHRNWTDGPVKKRKDLEPYALANIVATSDTFTSYLDRNAIPGLEKCVRSSDDRVKNTYMMAIRHFHVLNDKDDERNENSEKLLMANILRFIFAIRHTTGSSWICGDDTLGMEPETKDQSYPLYGKVSMPRMIIAQFDNFNCLKHLQPLEKRVFPKLEEFIGSNKPKYFFTIYLATFIFCHEVSIQCEDRYRHARQNSLSDRYSIPAFVHELQYSANIMLAYWHYYKKDLDPLSMDWRNREKTPLNGLTAEQAVFIIQSFEIARDKADELRIIKETNMWEHPLYFVAQMYEKDWTPRDIYNR